MSHLGIRLSYLLLIAATLLLTACGDPYERPMSHDLHTWKDDMQSALRRLPKADQETLARYVRRRADKGGVLDIAPGTTVRLALREQNEYEAERARKDEREKAERQRIEQERLAWQRRFADVLSVGYLGKQLEHTTYSGDFLSVTRHQ